MGSALIADGVKTMCAIPMLAISLSTFSALAMHSYGQKTLIYWPLNLATAIMTIIYILTMVMVYHDGNGRFYNGAVWNETLKLNVFSYLWPFSSLSTLLYTWQYFEMVVVVASSSSPQYFFWLRF